MKDAKLTPPPWLVVSKQQTKPNSGQRGETDLSAPRPTWVRGLGAYFLKSSREGWASSGAE